jgi:hypothetical protein
MHLRVARHDGPGNPMPNVYAGMATAGMQHVQWLATLRPTDTPRETR